MLLGTVLLGTALNGLAATTNGLRMTGIAVRDGKVVVSWQGGNGPYQLLCRTNMAQDWSKIGPVTSASSATNLAGSGPGCFFMVTSDLTPPTVPSGLQVMTNDCTAVTVRWNSAFDNFGGSGVRSYTVYRNGTVHRQISAISNSIVDVGLDNLASYTYSVAATDTVGNQSAPSAAVTTTIPACRNDLPIAAAGADRTVVAGTLVNFNGTESWDPDGTIVAYSWNFGDGTGTTGATAAHAYASPGTYVVTLYVTDNASGSSTDTAVITVTPSTPANQLPVANAGPDRNATVGVSVNMSGAGSYDADGSISSYAWNFGDGTTGTGMIVSHAYATVGQYTVRLTVTDNASATTTDTALVTVGPGANQPPVANAGPNQSGTAGVALTFSAAGSSDPDGVINSFAWNFGDGTSGTGSTVTHAYATAGQYTVTLTVTDNASATTTDTALVTVGPAANQPPVANAGPNQSGTAGVALTFSAGGSSDPDGVINSFAWNFGDGTSGTGSTVTHAYATAGQYTVTLTVTDNASATSTDTAVVTVGPAANQPPIANAGPARTEAVGVPVSFSAAASSDPDGVLTSYAWNFGDGTSGSGMNVTHAYAAPGVYTARLTVTDNAGASAVASSIVTIVSGTTPGTFIAQMTFGGSYADSAQAVAVDGEGNVLTGGTVSWRPFIARRLPTGTLSWSLTIGGAGSGIVHGIAADPAGNVLVTGNFYGTLDFGGGSLTSAGGYDIFVAKYSPAGAHLWSRRFGSGQISTLVTESGFGIAVDPRDGAVVVTGIFDGEINFGGGTLPSASVQNLFLVKFSTAGQHVWSKQVGSSGGASGNGVAVDTDGNIFITGSFGLTANFGAGTLTSPGAASMFLAKYSPAGVCAWSKSFGNGVTTASVTAGSAIAVDRSGNVVVSGSFQNTTSFGGQALTSAGFDDIFVAKYSQANGAHIWSKRFGGGSADSGKGVAVDAAGNVTLTGRVRGSVDFGGGPLSGSTGFDAFVADFAADGTHRWARRFGNWSEEGKAVTADGRGRVFVAGQFANTVDFGGGPVTSSGNSDFFLVEYSR